MKDPQPISAPVNFVVVDFGDNDFGWKMHKGLTKYFSENDFKHDPQQIKTYLIGFVLGEIMQEQALSDGKIDLDKIKWFGDYFSNMRVTFEQHAPTDDRDGGAMFHDINTKETYLY